MKLWLTLALALALSGSVFFMVQKNTTPLAPKISAEASTRMVATAPPTFLLTSPELWEGTKAPDTMVYDGNGCTGQNKSPEIIWRNPPKGTKSFALTVFDPDAPREGGWLHWFVLDIPQTVTSLPQLAGFEDGSGLPRGAISIPNSFGKSGYGGLCPPKGHGPHHYVFTVYAMPDAKTEYPLNAIGKSTVDWLSNKAIATATLTVTYERQ